MTLHPSIWIALLTFTAVFTSCNGQSDTSFPLNRIEEQGIIPSGHSKITKTQGTGPGANVHCGLQDKAGNIWFGTTGEGVYRYDGQSFVNFTKKDGLSGNSVLSILEDKNGTIWFGTDAGISRYDGRFITGFPMVVIHANNLYPAIPAINESSLKPAIWSMMQDKTGKIWLGTDKGVYCYDGTVFKYFLEKDSVINKSKLELKAITSILEDKAGNIWFSTWFEGLCRYDGKSITSFKPNGEVWFAAILEDKNGNIWAGRRSNGVCRFDGNSFTNVSQNGIFDSCCIRPLAEDKWGNIWFGTEHSDITKRETMGGIWRYDGKSFQNFTMKDGLINNSVWTILEDRTGNLWVGTRNTGLCRFDGKFFTAFSE